MTHDYWLERWVHEETGFHQDEINPYLRQYWPTLQLTPHSEVFVPLCGKSHDMRWLREQGHAVLGVELSPIAVQAFFEENNETPQQITDKKFTRYQANDMGILLGDFFDLSQDDLAQTSAVFDRASIVALPSKTRQRYVQHLVNILPPATQILLITFDYPQAEMTGPPFAISPDEVKTLYQPHAEIRLLSQKNILADNVRFQERGLSQLHERVYLLTLNQ